MRAQDNIDGLFAEYVQAAYKDYFQHSGRFVYQDLSRTDQVLTHSKIAYAKLLDDPKILLQVARSAHAQTLIRTKIRKEGPQYRVSMEWLNAPRMDQLALETFTLPEGNELDNARAELEKGLSRLISRIPWVGHVTGRDAGSVTVNIGSNVNLGPGDELVIGTLDEAKRHPLLNAIVDWRFSRTGKLIVESVDEKIAFCKVAEEEPGKQILRNQKILEVLTKPVEQVQPVKTRARLTRMTRSQTELDETGDEETPSKNEQNIDPMDLKPKLGHVSAGLALGRFSRDYNTAAGGGFSGSNGLLGGRFEGQLWLTGEIFTELNLGFNTGSYTQTPKPSGDAQPSVTTSMMRFRLDGGYTLLGSLASDEMPRAWIKIGYASDAYDLPFNTTNLTSPLTFKSFFLGVGGDLPIRGGFGAHLDLNFGLLNSISETGLDTGDSTGISNVQLAFGGYYHFKPRLAAKLDLEVTSQSVDFSSHDSISHRAFAVVPAILFSF